MTRFRKLATASLVATLVLVGIGGLVRATKSGLGCGDNWPHCPGDVDRALLIESSHRAAAGAVIFLIGLLVVLAWRRRDEAPRLFPLSAAALALVLVQALIGAVVVWLELRAESVVLHLSAAMSLVALLIYIVAVSSEGPARPAPSDARMARRARFAAGAVLLLMLVGSYVTGRGAGYVFSDWPLMNGALVPDLSNELYALHFLHRALAGVVGVIVTVVCIEIIRRSSDFPLQAQLARVALGLFALEVVVGALNIFTELNAGVVTAHLALSSLLWGSLVGIAVVSRGASQPISARAGRPVFEGVDN